jgi:sigma-B regulation protein RsbU (phosphoserine phosphatase)
MLMDKASIQRIFLPRRPHQHIAGVEIFFIWEPAEEVGGDYFFTNRFEETIGIEIGDVQGHGIDAALTMTALNGVFFSLREFRVPLQERVTIANQFLSRLRATNRIVTSSLFVATIDLAYGALTYINAGHPMPLYFSAFSEDPVVLPLTTGGMILGAMDNITFEAGQLLARPNDIILMFTDGFSEAFNSQKQEFANACDLRETLKSLASLSAEEIVQQLKASLDDFRQGERLHDDLTLVCVKFTDDFSPRRLSR